MPFEKRQIVLSDDELKHAAEAYSRMTPSLLIRSEIVGAAASLSGGEVSLRIACRPRAGEGELLEEVVLKDGELVELLIRFCLENNIPVPRRAAKRAELYGELLALVVEFDNGVGPSVRI